MESEIHRRVIYSYTAVAVASSFFMGSNDIKATLGIAVLTFSSAMIFNSLLELKKLRSREECGPVRFRAYAKGPIRELIERIKHAFR